MNTSIDAMMSDLKKTGAKTRILDRTEIDAWTVATKNEDVRSAGAADQESKGVANATAVLKKVDALLGAATK